MNGIMIYSFALIDRFLINDILGSEAVGLYVGVFQISSVLQVLGSSFSAAWFPWVFNYLADNKTSGNILEYSFSLLGLFAIVCSFFYVFMDNFMYFILGSNFIDGEFLLFGFVLGIFFQITYWIFSPIIQYNKKNLVLTYPIIPILLCSLFLNFYFLERQGLVFASLVYAMSWFLLALITVLYSFKLVNAFKNL
ncbi:hypothetical protein B0E43_22705 [Algoriphagus sp. A40]|nr:hypothetical protein B0E43_22705 [Algoriphagus sp. A40]